MTKQLFKGKVYGQRHVVNNILRTFNNTEFTAQSNWYTEANLLATKLASLHNLTVLQTAGVIASLSPLKSWDENQRIAKAFLKSGDAYHTSMFIDKAEQIVKYNGDFAREFNLSILNGNKIQNFFINIAFPKESTAVTIDRHAISVALGKLVPENHLKGITDKQYEFFAECYRQAANKVGVLPNEMQAVTWVKWRKIKSAKANAGVPF